jgi:hypothetical protein
MTSRRENRAEPENRQAAEPSDLDLDWREDERERRAIDDLYPDYGWLHPPDYVITVAKLPGMPGPPSLEEVLRGSGARTREPEPDLEAEP